MSPHQSSQSRPPSPKNSTVHITNPISRISTTQCEHSQCACNVSVPSAISAASLLAAEDVLDHDMSPLNTHTNSNPFSCYEIKTKQCNGGSRELDGSHKNNKVDMHFWSYSNTPQSCSPQNRLRSSRSPEKCYNAPKNSHLQGIPFHYSMGGRGYGRPICWNRRKVYYALYFKSYHILFLIFLHFET